MEGKQESTTTFQGYGVEIKNKGLKTNNKTPFVGLEVSKELIGNSADFYELPEHPELVVRKCYTPAGLEKQIRAELEPFLDYEHSTIEERENLVQKKKVEQLIKNANAFLEIGKRYGLNIVKTNYIVSLDPKTNKPDIFAVTDKISGKNLYYDNPTISEKIGEEIDEIYAGIFSHFKDSYLEDGVYWRDFKNSQIMCGTKYGEKEERAYIVDVDPLVTSWFDRQQLDGTFIREETEKSKEYNFWEKMEYTFTRMRSAEDKSQGRNFKKSREALQQLFSEIPTPNDDFTKDTYNEVKKYIKK